jgi:hypothetical protein
MRRSDLLHLGVVDIMNMNVYSANLHANHFRDCPRYLLLDVMAYVADIDIILKDHGKIGENRVVPDFKLNPTSDAAFKEPVYAGRLSAIRLTPSTFKVVRRAIETSTSGAIVVLPPIMFPPYTKLHHGHSTIDA